LAPFHLASVKLPSVRHVQERRQGNRVRHDTLTGRVLDMRNQGTARCKFLPAARVGHSHGIARMTSPAESLTVARTLARVFISVPLIDLMAPMLHGPTQRYDKTFQI
jgi:hypothetical protein